MARFICLSLCIAFATIAGCGPRTEVAKDKVLKKIDGMLGDMDVKMKSIEMDKEKLEEAKDETQLNKNKWKAELSLADTKIKLLEERMGKAKSALGKYEEHVKATEDVEIDGQTKTPEQVRDVVKKLIDLYQAAEKELNAKKNARDLAQKTFEKLETQQKLITTKLESLDTKIDDLKLKKKSLESMQAATKSASDASVLDKFDDLESSVDELFVSIDAALSTQEEKLDEELKQMETIEHVLNQEDTLDADLAKILGNSPEEEKQDDTTKDDTSKDDDSSEDKSNEETKE